MTTRVRLLTSVGGDWTARFGDEVDLDDETAARFIERGMAEPVAPPKRRSGSRSKPVETATDD